MTRKRGRDVAEAVGHLDREKKGAVWRDRLDVEDADEILEGVGAMTPHEPKEERRLQGVFEVRVIVRDCVHGFDLDHRSATLGMAHQVWDAPNADALVNVGQLGKRNLRDGFKVEHLQQTERRAEVS